MAERLVSLMPNLAMEKGKISVNTSKSTMLRKACSPFLEIKVTRLRLAGSKANAVLNINQNGNLIYTKTLHHRNTSEVINLYNGSYAVYNHDFPVEVELINTSTTEEFLYAIDAYHK